MGKEFNRWVIAIVTPPAMAIKFVAVNVYKFLFASRDIRSSRQRENELVLDVQRDLSFLFTRQDAKIVADETANHPRPFDYAIANVAVDNLFIRFVRGRGELRVQVASRHDPHNWVELETVLCMVDPNGRFELKSPCSLEDVASVLEPRMSRLREAFSDKEFPAIEQQLSKDREYKQAVIRQWETEINRRLYPDR